MRFLCRLRIVLFSLSGTLLVFLILSAHIHAQIPETINYQGRITQPGAGPFNGMVPITFSIYNQRSGMAPALFTETHPAVEVVNGRFSVEIGSVDPDANPLTALDFDEPYFLGISVDQDPEMSPRLPFTSVAFALKALNAQRAQNADQAQNANQASNSNRAQNSDNADFATTAGTAQSVADESITLSSLSPSICAEGQVLRTTATGWECAAAVRTNFQLVQQFFPVQNLGAFSFFDVTLDCPAGTQPVAGGGRYFSGNRLVLAASAPTNTGWFVRYLNEGFTITTSIQVSVICASVQ